MKITFNSLRTRIVALVVAFCVLIGVIFVLAANFAYMSYYDELRQRQGLSFAQNVAQMYPELGKFDALNREDAENRFEQMLLLDPSSAIYLLDNEGRVRAVDSAVLSAAQAESICSTTKVVCGRATPKIARSEVKVCSR